MDFVDCAANASMVGWGGVLIMGFPKQQRES